MADFTKFGMALRQMKEQIGSKAMQKSIREMLVDGSVKAEDFTFRGIMEAVGSDDFPAITSELINNKVMSGFHDLDLIGDRLVTKVDSKVKNDYLAGFNAIDAEPEEVGELGEYNEAKFGDKKFLSRNIKVGRHLTISNEAAHWFNNTGEILREAQTIGERAALHRERRIVYAVQDVSGYESYWPDGTNQALFDESTDLKNLITGSGGFGESALQSLMTQVSANTDDTGWPIFIPVSKAILLHPVELRTQVWQMSESSTVPESGEGAKNIWKGQFQALDSPFVSNQSSTTFYWGWPAKCFVETIIRPIEILTLKPNSGELFDVDAAAKFKIRYFSNVTAVSPKHWYKITA